MKSMGISVDGNPITETEKKMGEKIASNYKRQVAERLAREQAEAEGFELKSMMSGDGKSMGSRMGKTGMNSTFMSGKSPKKAEKNASKLIS